MSKVFNSLYWKLEFIPNLLLTILIIMIILLTIYIVYKEIKK